MIEFDDLWFEINIVKHEEIKELHEWQTKINDFDQDHLYYFLLNKFVSENKLNSYNYTIFFKILSTLHISISLAILYKILHQFTLPQLIFEKAIENIEIHDKNSKDKILIAKIRRNNYYQKPISDFEYTNYLENDKLHYAILDSTKSSDRLMMLHDKTNSKKLKNIVKTKLYTISKNSSNQL